MSALNNLLAGINRLPGKNMLALIFAMAAIVSVLSATFMWGRGPDYRVLYANVSDRDGGEIIAALGQMNVPYKFAEGGGAILVPAANVHDARLRIASQGLPRGANVGFELMDSQKFGITQFQEQVNYQRSLEGELARSIQSIGSVQGARVHLAIPKPTVFVREQQKPTASVMVTLHPGRALDRQQIAGIVHLVASSVPELSTKNISVLDQAGNLLSSAGDTGNLDPAQLTYVRELEAGYIRRIQDIIEPIVGKGNAKAQVTAEIDFSLAESTAETYKPNGDPASAALRSQSLSETGNAQGAAQGIPGAASNQVPGAASGAATATSSQKKDSQTTFELDRTVRYVKAPVGSIKRLSAAVVVNHRRVQAEGKAASEPLKKEELDQINALVKEAMGFNETRGDTLNIANAQFTVEERDAVPELPMWQQPENIQMAKDIGKGLGAALLILYVLFGLIRPAVKQISAPPPQVTALPSGSAPDAAGSEEMRDQNPRSRLDYARTLAKDDPRIVANVVKTWVAKE